MVREENGLAAPESWDTRVVVGEEEEDQGTQVS